MSEKPLYVRVAEALGWTDLRLVGGLTWFGHHEGDRGDEVTVPHFDVDWSATGPLIEKYGLEINRDFNEPVTRWSADAAEVSLAPTLYGPTPLIAVCNLILALKEAGRL